MLARAARGDAEARTEILAAITEYSDKHDLYRHLLELDGDELKTRLLEILPRWRETVFAPTAAGVAGSGGAGCGGQAGAREATRRPSSSPSS